MAGEVAFVADRASVAGARETAGSRGNLESGFLAAE